MARPDIAQNLDPTEKNGDGRPTNGAGVYYHLDSDTTMIALNEQTADALVHQGFKYQREIRDGDVHHPELAAGTPDGSMEVRMAGLESLVGNSMTRTKELEAENAELRKQLEAGGASKPAAPAKKAPASKPAAPAAPVAPPAGNDEGGDQSTEPVVIEQFELNGETYCTKQYANGDVRCFKGTVQMKRVDYETAKKEAENAQGGNK